MAAKNTIDLNCDLGEGYPHDREIFPLISSANIACGGHAGDRHTITASLELCKKYDVAAGVHPSYPDKQNFGRRSVKMERKPMQDAVRSQLKLFTETAFDNKIPVHHVKLHGALYNDCAINTELAEQVLEVLREFDIRMIYGLSGSLFNQLAAAQGFKVIDEIFADRAYMGGGQLLPRNMPGAVLDNPQKMRKQLTSLLTDNRVETAEGEIIRLHAGTICLHGDNPGACRFIEEIRQLLKELKIDIAHP